MELKEYFEKNKGTGILSTADSDGNVDSAIYARPHVMEDGKLVLLMRNRLSYSNLQSNPKAAYLFLEQGPGYKGVRFFLKKVKEDTDPELIASLRRRVYHEDITGEEETHAVFFDITKELPLIGARKR
ncbi:MAG: pyridoxamine 5'-phosphate oxidase family protein [Desulfosalsimonadaceae bacterium]